MEQLRAMGKAWLLHGLGAAAHGHAPARLARAHAATPRRGHTQPSHAGGARARPPEQVGQEELSLTQPQLPEVATPNLLAHAEVRTNHQHPGVGSSASTSMAAPSSTRLGHPFAFLQLPFPSSLIKIHQFVVPRPLHGYAAAIQPQEPPESRGGRGAERSRTLLGQQLIPGRRRRRPEQGGSSGQPRAGAGLAKCQCLPRSRRGCHRPSLAGPRCAAHPAGRLPPAPLLALPAAGRRREEVSRRGRQQCTRA